MGLVQEHWGHWVPMGCCRAGMIPGGRTRWSWAGYTLPNPAVEQVLDVLAFATILTAEEPWGCQRGG